MFTGRLGHCLAESCAANRQGIPRGEERTGVTTCAGFRQDDATPHHDPTGTYGDAAADYRCLKMCGLVFGTTQKTNIPLEAALFSLGQQASLFLNFG